MAGRKSLDSRGRTMADTASAVGSMLLFVLFALCMLMAVAVAADTYSRIKNGYQQSLGAAASIKYVSNKLRSADSVTLLEGGAAVVSGDMVSVIYCNGGLYEKSSMVGDDISPAGGDKISDIDTMSITEHYGLYEITVSSGGQTSSMLVRKG